jgi:peptidyl-prolyl cis-trans isomerase SurA
LALLHGCCQQEQPTEANLQVKAPVVQPAPPTPEPQDPVVAEVGQTQVKLSELESELSHSMDLRRKLGARTSQAWEERKRHLLLQDRVERELVAQEAQRRDLKITQQQIEDALDRKIETTFKTRQSYLSYLEKTQRSEASYQRELRDELLLERLIGRRDRLKVTPEEVEALYQERRESFRTRERAQVSVILIKVPRGASAQTRALIQERAQGLAHKARARGADFAALARAHSQGPTAAHGGKLGWVYSNNLDPRLAPSAFRLPIGGVSDPILTRLGYQILKVQDRRPAGYKPLPEVRELLVTQLQRRKWRKAREALMTDLKRRHHVRIYHDRLP